MVLLGKNLAIRHIDLYLAQDGLDFQWSTDGQASHCRMSMFLGQELGE